MDVAIGQKFRTRADRSGNDQIATLGVDLLAAAYRRGNDAGRAHFGFRCRWWCRLGLPDNLGLWLQWPLAGAGRRQYRQVDGDGGGDVLDAVGADGQGTQAVVAADPHQAGQVDCPFVGWQFVQRQHQRRVAEEIRCLGDFGRQLAVEGFKVIARQFQYGNGEHAALELEHGGGVGCVVWAHGLHRRLVAKKVP